MLLLIPAPEVHNGREKAVPEKATKILKKWERGDRDSQKQNESPVSNLSNETRYISFLWYA